MNPSRFTLPPAAFAEAFPFHLVLEAGLNVVQRGRSLARLLPDLPLGKPFSDFFALVPPPAELSFATLRETSRQPRLLACRGHGLRLRGCFIESDSHLIFLGSPWPATPAELRAAGCQSHDFAPHDPLHQLLGATDAPLPDTPAPEPVAPVEAPAAPPTRILLVEDNTTNQLLATELLARLNCTVTIANNGREGVELAIVDSFDAILMDCHMPEMDGFAAASAIRLTENGTRTPIIALTANAMRGDRERCQAAGMDDYIAKPISVELLTKKLAHWVPARARPAPAAPAVSTTPPPAEAPAGPLDLQAALARMGGNRRLLAKLAASFRDTYPQNRQRLHTALSGQDAAEAVAQAHTLRSTTAMFSANRAAALFADLEKAAHDADWAAADRAWASLQPEMAALLDALSATHEPVLTA